MESRATRGNFETTVKKVEEVASELRTYIIEERKGQGAKPKTV